MGVLELAGRGSCCGRRWLMQAQAGLRRLDSQEKADAQNPKLLQMAQKHGYEALEIEQPG